jgi:acetyltransferase-like isoleucine patch superfamily enzyme
MIHPLSDVKTKHIGEGTTIWQFVVILEEAQIGANVNINCNVFIENDVVVGNNVTIKSGVQLWDGVRVADDVFVGPNVTFTNDLVPKSKIRPASFVKTNLLKGCSIGANATLIAGITIGEFALIGAGSVVTKDVPPYTVWYGNPARHNGYVTLEGKILGLDLMDKETNEKYNYINGSLYKSN